jgi:two-component system C4-dicarboxylate transport sensor histidine kinase DctB
MTTAAQPHIHNHAAGIPRLRTWLLASAIFAALATAIVLLGTPFAKRSQLAEAATRAEATLRLAVTALNGHMRRYEALPPLIADNDDIRELLADPTPARQATMNAYLKQLNGVLESSDLYIMLPDGNTVAASNFDGPASFVGENFSYRPYFTDAIAGGMGRFFALGTTSLKRGYYFSAPVFAEGVRDRASIAGVVVVKVDIEPIEAAWQGAEGDFIVTDPEGIIFMSARPEWLYSGLLPLTQERLARTAVSRRYADAELRELPIAAEGEKHGQHTLTLATNSGRRELLVIKEEMPEAGWTVKLLVDTVPIYAQANTQVAGALLILLIVSLAIAIVLQRRARLSERMALQRAAREDLEQRVVARTADLATVNRRLETEVAERIAAEAQLRQTQADLVQAGKLAALGQMAAALSHEFNQPLTAVRTYADNAERLIARGRHGEAAEAVGRIASLTERLASIARHLRNFARKPNERLGAVAVDEALRDTLEIVGWRLKAADATLEVDMPDPAPSVMAGSVRLQQVLVNLISNAADAIEGQDDRRIAFRATEAPDGTVSLEVRDHGPGVPQAIAGRIFDPFFTTKGVGKGLGLGLSISYNIVSDFGGRFAVANHPDGGAVFTVTLKSAAALAEAAE